MLSSMNASGTQKMTFPWLTVMAVMFADGADELKLFTQGRVWFISTHDTHECQEGKKGTLADFGAEQSDKSETKAC